jgi:cysteine-rich repeat protein
MPGRTLMLVAAALAGAALAAPPALAAKPKPVACTGRWVLDAGSKGLIFGEQTPTTDALAVAPKQLVLAPCGTTRAAVRATKKATKVSARFKTCGALKAVVVRATIPTGCATMTGTIKARKVPARAFTARLVTGCGDGIVDVGGGETCEVDGDCQPGQQCDACSCATTTTTTTLAGSTSTTSTTVTTTTSTTNTTLSLLCGNGEVDPGEQCDDGNDVSGDACDPNCTFPGCGNGAVDPDETCDDGNTLDGDNCPSSCVEQSCTPTATPATATVGWDAPSSVSAITVLVDYPEGKVNVPGHGGTVAPGTFTTFPSGTSQVPNVLGNDGYAVKMVVSKATAINPRPGTLFKMNMTRCEGAPAATAGDYGCTVLEAFGTDGTTPVAATCTVSVP